MKEFNVFDEWGNYVGKFVPEGGGINGILGVLTLIFAGIMIFVIYVLVRLIVEGFKALSRRQWGMAIVGLSPIWLTGLLVILGIGAAVVQKYQQQVQDQQLQEIAQALNQNPPIDLKVSRGPCPEGIECAWGQEGPYLILTIRNNWTGKIEMGVSPEAIPTGHPGPDCYHGSSLEIAPGAEFTQFCVDYYEDILNLTDVCVFFSYELSSYDPLYSYNPQARICRKIE